MKRWMIWCAAGIFVAALVLVGGNMLWRGQTPQTDHLSQEADGTGAASYSQGYDMGYADGLRAQTGEQDRLNGFSYSLAGGELGGHHMIELRRDGDHARLTVRRQESHDAAEQVTDIEVPLTVLDGVDAIVSVYGMRTWDQLPSTGVFVLDADMLTVCLDYDSGSTVIPDDADLPEHGGAAIRSIREYLLTFVPDAVF